MRYKLITLSIAAAASIFACGQTALASSDTSGTDTNGFIEFVQDSDGTGPKPVDPLDPSEEIEADKPATGGEYSIIYTSDFQFGEHKLSSGDATFYAANPTITYPDGTKKEVTNFVELADRSGSKNGWKLSAKLAGPLSKSDGTTIKGTTLSIGNIQANSVQGFENSLITLAETITLSGDTQETAIVAQDTAGKTAGFWVVTFGQSIEQGKKSVSLFVPNTQSIEAGSYNTSVVWTLEAAL